MYTLTKIWFPYIMKICESSTIIIEVLLTYAYFLCRYAGIHTIRLTVLCYNGSGSNYSTFSDTYTFQDNCVYSNPNIIFNEYFCGFIVEMP